MWGGKRDGGVLTLPIMVGTLMIAAAAMLAMIIIMSFMDIVRPQRAARAATWGAVAAIQAACSQIKREGSWGFGGAAGCLCAVLA